jgi:hypothetical protein
MGGVEDLAAVLGAGRNQTYDLLDEGRVPGAFRLRWRWFIPKAVLAKIASGEVQIAPPASVSVPPNTSDSGYPPNPTYAPRRRQSNRPRAKERELEPET